MEKTIRCDICEQDTHEHDAQSFRHPKTGVVFSVVCSICRDNLTRKYGA